MVSITALIENEQNFWADIVFAGTMIALFKLGCGESLTSMCLWVAQHWFLSIGIFLLYLVAGTLYSLVKWAIFVSDGKDKLVRENNNFYPNNWTPGRHKSKITHWMIYWPISGIWTLISNPVVRAFNRIFYKLETVYQKISDRIMKDLIAKNKK